MPSPWSPVTSNISDIAINPHSSLPSLDLPGTMQVMRGPALDVPPGFPLGDNATVHDVMMLVDALALRIYPTGYWQVSWATSTANVIIFLLIAIALRAYRFRKTPVPLWLLRIEKRPVTVLRGKFGALLQIGTSISTKSRPALPGQLSSNSAETESQSGGLRRRIISLFRTGKASHAKAIEKDSAVKFGDSSSTLQAEQGEARKGRFITASCVNCHLVLTGGYVIMLFMKTIVSYDSRNPDQLLPLLDPGLLEVFMIGFIFSTAYFAALGYIAILLPWVPAWLWNITVSVGYMFTDTTGVLAFGNIASSASQIDTYRKDIYRHFLYTLSNDQATMADIYGSSAPADATALNLAKLAYDKAIEQRFWLKLAYGLVAAGGLFLSINYFVILVTLTRKVALELVQLRNAPPRHPEDKPDVAAKVSTVAKWPSTAFPYSKPISTSQPAFNPSTPSALSPGRCSLTLRAAARTPPPTPAPSGPLPLLPVEATQASRRGSGSSIGSVTCSAVDSHLENKAMSRPTSPIMFSRDAPMDGIHYQIGLGQLSKRSSVASVQSLSMGHRDVTRLVPTLAVDEAKLAFVDDKDDHRSVESASASHDHSELAFGPRTRVDSQPTPWAVNNLHDDLASNEGYVAVCRFLFNCIIDHVAVMLQCMAFGATSIHLFLVYNTKYPFDAHQASLEVARVNMVFLFMFTLLYFLNSLNLFAPFLLFPGSQVKLATMLAAFSSPNSGLGRPADKPNVFRRGSRSKRRWSTAKPAQQGKSRGTLRGQGSTQDLLGMASKMTSESYSNSSKQAIDRPSSDLNHENWVVRGGVVGIPSRPTTRDGAVYPPNAAMTGTPASQMNSKKLRWDGSSEVGASRNSMDLVRTPVGIIASQVAAVVKIFHSSTPFDVPSADAGSQSHNSSQPSPSSPIVNALQFSQGHQASGASPGTLTNAADEGHTASSSAVKPWSAIWPFSSAARTAKAANAAPAPSASSQLAGKSSGVASSDYETCETSLRRRGPGRQMVLDSLISSHALPIQGFYCHSSAASSSLSTWRQPQSDNSMEMGVSRTHQDNSLHMRPRKRPAERERQHPPQVKVEENAESEEELRTIQDNTDSENEDYNQIGEASKRRRQRLRQQFRTQVVQHQQAEGPTRRSSMPANFQGQYPNLSIGVQHHPLIRVVDQTPSPPQVSDQARDNEPLRLPGAGLKQTSTIARKAVPVIVAYPPTPVTPVPRHIATQDTEEERVEEMATEHDTVISIPVAHNHSRDASDDESSEVRSIQGSLASYVEDGPATASIESDTFGRL